MIFIWSAEYEELIELKENGRFDEDEEKEDCKEKYSHEKSAT